MNKAILFRNSLEAEEEFTALKQTKWAVYERLLSLPRDNLIIGRYSVLPFYREVEAELGLIGCRLINTYDQHRYIADLENWYGDLKDYTPKTWFDWCGLPEGSYVIKGRTNSRKFQWATQMYCPTKADVPKRAEVLLYDPMISEQGLCVRKYVPLRRFGTGINGLPITNEWRVFCYDSKIVAGDYYWANYEECKPYDWEQLPHAAFVLLCKVIDIVKHHTNFYVIDIAETESGEWIVIELNDGQQSGLSMIEPSKMYNRLMELI